MVDSDRKFLDLLEREKSEFFIDLSCESCPEKAFEILSLPEFNPRALIVSESFPGSSLTGFDIIESVRKKSNALQMISAMVLDNQDVNVRLHAIKNGINYVFHKPILGRALLRHMVNVLEVRSLHEFKILVLDDDPDICCYLSKVFSEIGALVKTIVDPFLLFDILHDFRPDLLMLDIILPKYDGISLLKTIRSDIDYRNLIIAVITSRNDPELREEAYSSNADDIIYKPFEKSSLQLRVLNLVRRLGVGQETPAFRDISDTDDRKELLNRLRRCLSMRGQEIRHLALFEADKIDKIIQMHGKGAISSLMITLVNYFDQVIDATMTCFTLNSLKFAIVFDSYDLEDVREKMYAILFKAHAEQPFELDFSCCIVPIFKGYESARTVMIDAEHGIEEAKNNETGPVKIVVHKKPDENLLRKVVCLIDSDEEFLEILRAAFESHHVEVMTFDSGEKALKAILSRTNETTPSLIISERQLPDMDGIEILKKLNTSFRVPIPFYFLTVYSSDKDVTEGLKYGASDYIAKPFYLSTLIRKALRTMNVNYSSLNTL